MIFSRTKRILRAAVFGALVVSAWWLPSAKGATAADSAAVADQDAFVRISPRDPRYFELSNGHPFIPIGVNMIHPEGKLPEGVGLTESQGMDMMKRWMDQLSENGGNTTRIWLNTPFWDIEDKKAGVYDEAMAKRVDRVFEMLREHNLRAMFTIESFRSFGSPTTKPMWYWKTVHDVKNGGTATSVRDWFNNPASRKQFLGKLDYYRNRYGDRPEVFAWELWNEEDCVFETPREDWLAWTQDMFAALHERFPHNMATTSLGSLDKAPKMETYRALAAIPGNDTPQIHRYLDLGGELEITHGPVDVFAADAVHIMRELYPDKPVLLSESGAVEPKHSGTFKLYAKDKDGIILHDVIFCPFFAGAAGTGMNWQWAEYVDTNHLWWQFARFHEATRDLDPPAEGFEPIMLKHDRLRVYALKGRHTSIFWARDGQNTWQSELAQGIAPELLENVSIDISELKLPSGSTVRIYDPWTNAWTSSTPVSGTKIALPAFRRSIVVRIDHE